MNLEKAVGPRKTLKARLCSKRCQTVVRYPMDKWLNRCNLLFCFVSFVIFVDKPVFLG